MLTHSLAPLASGIVHRDISICLAFLGRLVPGRWLPFRRTAPAVPTAGSVTELLALGFLHLRGRYLHGFLILVDIIRLLSPDGRAVRLLAVQPAGRKSRPTVGIAVVTLLCALRPASGAPSRTAALRLLPLFGFGAEERRPPVDRLGLGRGTILAAVRMIGGRPILARGRSCSLIDGGETPRIGWRGCLYTVSLQSSAVSSSSSCPRTLG